MRLILLAVMIALVPGFSKAQDVSGLPLVVYTAKVQDTSKPMVVYLSGDGGVNSFSKSFCQQLSDKGYSAVLFNSLKYFWSKKTPAQAAADVEKVVRFYKASWKKSKVILVGYSFGADVSPFVFNRMPATTQSFIRNIVLLSPAPRTDFEIHVTQMFGKKQVDGMSVIDEINKITSKQILILQGEKEEDKIDAASLKIRNYKIVVMKGGHHYDKDTEEITNNVIQNLK